MKRNKKYLILSVLFGLAATVFWSLRFFYHDIHALIPLTLNTIQFGFLGFIGKEDNGVERFNPK